MSEPVTTIGNHGPVHTIALPRRHKGLARLKIVPRTLFGELIHAATVDGRFFRAGISPLVPDCILVCTCETPRVDLIDRDDAWDRRTELLALLTTLLGRLEAASAHDLPLHVLTLTYLEAFPAGADVDTVLRVFTRTTQRQVDLTVDRLLSEGALDTEAALPPGLGARSYSHIAWFARVYAAQIRWITRELMRICDRVVRVVDLGCGAAHFLLALAAHLENRGLLARVELVGLDISDRDMRHGCELMCERTCAARFSLFDLTAPQAADELRRMRPDFVVVNHVLEHLPPEPIENRHLHDLLLAARVGVSISVPFDAQDSGVMAGHMCAFGPADIVDLGRRMPVRCAGAIESIELCEGAAQLGLLAFRRDDATRSFDATHVVQPREVRVPEPAVLDDFTQPFSLALFARSRGRAPVVGTIRDRAAFGAIGGQPQQARQLLVKRPGDPLRLPDAFAQFDEAVAIILGYDRAYNPNHERSFAYLNVFRGISHVDSYRGLSLQLHGDQLQGLLNDRAYPPDWSYIVSSALPTTLFEQTFDLSDALHRFDLGEKINLYDEFAQQAREACRYRSEPFVIQLLSPYIVHAATPALEPTPRVFLKVAFSTRRFWDNRELRQTHYRIDDWLEQDSIGYVGGALSHVHWNERLVASDVVRR